MANSNTRAGRRYALVTAAYNEERFIERPIASVVSQSLQPVRWIIVSDGSTDRTDEIVRNYADRYPFIQLHRITEDHPRNFTAQANAINEGCGLLTGCDYDYIGNLDADISLEPDYFEALVEHLRNDEALGLAGGFIHEELGGEFRSRKNNRTVSVAHAVQLFRKGCFEAIGGYLPLRYGGSDWHAEVTARMKGWRVQAFPGLRAFHHRPTGTAGGLLRYSFRQGLMDFSLGCHPLFEIGKLFRRVEYSADVLGGIVFRLAGFAWAYCQNGKRPVSDEFVEFLRKEQRKRIRVTLSKGRKGVS